MKTFDNKTFIYVYIQKSETIMTETNPKQSYIYTIHDLMLLKAGVRNPYISKYTISSVVVIYYRK